MVSYEVEDVLGDDIPFDIDGNQMIAVRQDVQALGTRARGDAVRAPHRRRVVVRRVHDERRLRDFRQHLVDDRHEPDELAERLEREDLTVLAYRFEGDAFCRAERFAAYAEALGPRFEARVLPDAAANPGPRPPFFEQFVTTPHSVVTVDLIDRAGEPTVKARDEILDFFRVRLAGPG